MVDIYELPDLEKEEPKPQAEVKDQPRRTKSITVIESEPGPESAASKSESKKRPAESTAEAEVGESKKRRKVELQLVESACLPQPQQYTAIGRAESKLDVAAYTMGGATRNLFMMCNQLAGYESRTESVADYWKYGFLDHSSNNTLVKHANDKPKEWTDVYQLLLTPRAQAGFQRALNMVQSADVAPRLTIFDIVTQDKYRSTFVQLVAIVIEQNNFIKFAPRKRVRVTVHQFAWNLQCNSIEQLLNVFRSTRRL